jgi:phage-related protein
MWTRFTVDGVVRAPISNKPFYSNLKNMNPQKLFNYVIQSLETSRNILILKEVLGYLKDKKSGVALYTYDAILFDFDLSDGKETLEELKRLLEASGKYPVKFKSNTNLVLD